MTGPVPEVFTLDEMLLAVQGLDLAAWSAEDLETACSRLPSESGPEFLWVVQDAITRDALAGVLGSAWSMAEQPTECLPSALWAELFEDAGYTVTPAERLGGRASRPKTPMTLYRGATDEARAGWSWTDDVETARRFAHGELAGRSPGRVWQATVPPDRLLAEIHARGEREFVIDPRDLEIVPYAGDLMTSAEAVQEVGAA